ncbi:hypothetical protein GCM10009809_20070 [Isoptericola hypogeus]|uniref:RDD domain-containing protein n=1 Tax=Isoptericola hypogeus TaxID=300179 RepID=A0ABN2JEL0_9MICO
MTTTLAGTPPPAAPPNGGTPVAHALGPFTPDRPKASWGSRAVAVLLDSAVVASIAFLGAGDAPSLATLPGLGEPATAGGAAWAAWTLVALGVLQAYTGMTPGKRVAGIAVVDAGSGRPIGLLGTVLRWLAHLLDSILVIGYIRAAFHVEGRTFADSLVGTVAVRTTTPEPHPWVARLRRLRDDRAPWLRWPRRVTGGIALVLCAASAAMSLVHGGGGGQLMAESEAACDLAGAEPYVATIGSAYSEEWDTRLGMTRTTAESWQAVVGWSTDPAAEGSVDPNDGESPRATLVVRSPDGRQYSSAQTSPDGSGDDETWWSVDVDHVASALVDAPEDVSGWAARATLADASGDVVAECTGVVPEVDASTTPW